MNKNRYSLFLLFLVVFSVQTKGTTFYSRTSGNWTTAATWSTVACGGTAATTTPGASDNVVICTGNTITMNGNPGSCLSLTVTGTANWTSAFTTNVGAGGLTLNNGSSLTGSTTGTLIVSGPTIVSSGATTTIDALNGTFTGTTTLSGTATFTSTSGTKTFTNIIINSGGNFNSSSAETYAVSGNVTMNGGTLSGSSTGTMNISGTFNVPAGASATIGRLTLNVTGITTVSGTLTDNNISGSKVFSTVNVPGGVFNSTVNETYNINGDFNLTGGTITGTATGKYLVAGAFNVNAGTSAFDAGTLTVSGASTITGTLNWGGTSGNKTFNDLTINSGGTFNDGINEKFSIGGNFQNNGTFISGTNTYTFTGTGKTFSGSASVTSFEKISCSGSYTNNFSLTVANSLNGGGTFTQGTTGILYYKGGVGGPGVGTFNASAVGNTVDYNLTSSFSIPIPSDGSYYNLTVDGGLTKTLSANTIAGGTVLIVAGTILNSGNKNLNIGKDFTNNNSFVQGSATVTFNGSAGQNINGTVSTTFNNLTISNTAGVTLGRNTIVAAALNFTSGVITTGANKLTINAGGTISGAGTGKFVNGSLEKNIATGASVSRTYEVGNGSSDYLPATLLFASVSVAGNITVKVNNGDHPNISTSLIDDLKSVNRYWTLTNSGTTFTTYSATCTFIGIPSDADAGSNTTNYYMAVYNAGAWTTLTAGARTSTSTQASGITTMGDLQLGEPKTASVLISASTGTTICSGTSVTFTAVPTNGGTTPSYQWKVNGANVGVNSPTYVTTTLTNGQLVTCVMTSSIVGITGSPATSNILTMSVNPNLPVSVSITSTATTICAGTNVIFTATPTNGGAAPTYQWKLNGSNVGISSTTYSTTALANGDVLTCVLTSNAVCPTGNPATSNSITMTVNPIVTASVSISASSTTICPGTSVTFSATPTNGGTIPSFQWKLNGSNVGTGLTTYSNSSLINGDVVTCDMTSNATCVTGSPATSNSVTITVNPSLPVSVTISASPGTTICAGTATTFTAVPTNGGATPSFQWKLNGVTVGASSSTYSNSTLASGDVVTCIVTSTASCSTGSPATSNSLTMTVSPILPASVNISATATTICAGTNVTFTATPTNGGAGPSYQWKLNGGNVGASSTTYSNTALANGDVVTCVLTSNATCATGSPATSNSVTMTVNPNLPVSVSISATATTICAGTNVTFTAIPTNGGTTPSYQWQLNGSNVGASSATYSNAALANGDIVTCVLTSNATCATGSPATSNSVMMTVNPNVTASVSISASPAGSICSGTSVTFTAVPVNGGGAPSYQWKLNGTNVGASATTYSNSSLVSGDLVTCVLTSTAVCVSGSPATSNTVTMNVNGSGAWLGTASTNWNSAGNWCGGVPTNTSDISITAGTPFAPSLTAPGNCRNMNLAAGVIVNLNGQNLNIYGVSSGAGTLKGSASSSLTFASGIVSGGTFNMDQTTPGTTNVLNQLSVNRTGASVTIGNALNVTGAIDISAGTLATSGNLTLTSNSSGTGRIGELVAGADVTGNVTVQRFIPAGTDGWMFICSPVTGVTLADWDDDIVTGGFPGTDYPPSPNPSIAGYDETLPGIYDDGYTTPSSITDPIVTRAGYWAYIINTPVTLDVTGPVLKNLQTFPVTYTNDVSQPAEENGWNLLANPYPSTIDWDAAGWTKTNVNDAVYMYSATLDQYTSYVGGIGTNGGSNLIASSQAFLVQTSGSSPVLKLTESVKSVTDGLFIRSSSPMYDDFLKLDLAGNGYKDETYIRFDSAATDNFDNSLDALKFYSFNSVVPGIGTVEGGQLLSVNSIPLLTTGTSVPLTVHVGVSGTYTIKVDSLTRFPSDGCMIMTDLKTGAEIDLRSTPSYSFYIEDTTSYPRFVINLGNVLPVTVVAPSCNASGDGAMTIHGIGAGPWDYTWRNPAGNIVQTHTAVYGMDSLINVNGGVYSVTVSGNVGSCNGTMVEYIDVAEPDAISAYTGITDASCSGIADGEIDIIAVNGGVAPFLFNWSNGVATMSNPGIIPATYTVTITDSSGCSQALTYTVDQTSGVQSLFDMSVDTAYLGSSAVVFTNNSTGSGSYTWNFGDGSPLDFSVAPSHTFLVAGIYSVTLIANGGSCIDTLVQQIVVIDPATMGVGSASNIDGDILFSFDNNTVNVSFNLNETANAVIELYNAMGQSVQSPLETKAFRNSVSIGTADLKEGIYFVRIRTEQGIAVRKFVKG